MRATVGILLLLLVAPAVSATVVINSQDWRDVYTGMHYAALTSQDGYFVVNSQQGADLATRIPGDEVTLITGRQQAMAGFRQLLTSRGITVDERNSNNAIDFNHQLITELNPENLIIIDDAYGYNAISVATYAKATNSGVIFADDAAVDVIDDVNPDTILLYGHIPTELVTAFEPYNPEILNEQDKFEDNFALVERFQEVSPRDTIVLTNGEFIEAQLITDVNPVLFIGKQNVPDEVIDFLNDNGFTVSVLVGNSLAPNARYIKDQTGMSLFIKFAQGRNQEQFALDLFNLPVPQPEIIITQAEYDPQTQELLVTYQNPGEIATYFTVAFETEDGTVDQDTPVFIDAGTYKTQRYTMAQPQPSLPYTLLYGASPLALELIVQGSVQVDIVTVQDESEIDVVSAEYSPGDESFKITLENPSTVDAFALVELADVRIGSERVRIGAPVVRVRAGQQAVAEVPATLTERDIDRNDEIVVEVFYGEREFSLIKFQRTTVSFSLAAGLSMWYVGLAIAVALILIWFVVRKKPKKQTYRY